MPEPLSNEALAKLHARSLDFVTQALLPLAASLGASEVRFTHVSSPGTYRHAWTGGLNYSGVIEVAGQIVDIEGRGRHERRAFRKDKAGLDCTFRVKGQEVGHVELTQAGDQESWKYSTKVPDAAELTQAEFTARIKQALVPLLRKPISPAAPDEGKVQAITTSWATPRRGAGAITGTLEGIQRRDAVAYLRNQGIKVYNRVDRKTAFLIVGDLKQPSKKLKLATKYGLPMWSWDEALAHLDVSPPSPSAFDDATPIASTTESSKSLPSKQQIAAAYDEHVSVRVVAAHVREMSKHKTASSAEDNKIQAEAKAQRKAAATPSTPSLSDLNQTGRAKAPDAPSPDEPEL